jgi:CheY-like chemotaxis protein
MVQRPGLSPDKGPALIHSARPAAFERDVFAHYAKGNVSNFDQLMADLVQIAPAPVNPDVTKATSELNNLLQIIAGVTTMLEQGRTNSGEHLVMLRRSVERAQEVALNLTDLVGGAATEKVLPAMSDQAGAAKRAVMVVDDEVMGLTLMQRILTDAGFAVVTAQSGFECVEEFRRRPHYYSLILLDLSMPFMNGEETFTRLKEIREDVTVLLCSGFVEPERLERLKTAGLSGFVRKPVSPDQVVTIVRSTLARIRYGSVVAQAFSTAV